MTGFQRHAVYFAPRPGAFADAAAGWLGWDAEAGRAVPHPDLGLPVAQITAGARKYGFHGTLRAPFRAAAGLRVDDVAAEVGALARRIAPAQADGLRLADMEGFLALTPDGDAARINRLAAEVVAGTDALRAPLTPDDIARRRPETLTPRQRTLLDRWGYPYVMEEFRFHLTLTDRLDDPASVAQVLGPWLAPVLPRPFVIEDLCLFGEDATGRFHLTHRYALTG